MVPHYSSPTHPALLSVCRWHSHLCGGKKKQENNVLSVARFKRHSPAGLFTEHAFLSDSCALLLLVLLSRDFPFPSHIFFISFLFARFVRIVMMHYYRQCIACDLRNAFTQHNERRSAFFQGRKWMDSGSGKKIRGIRFILNSIQITTLTHLLGYFPVHPIKWQLKASVSVLSIVYPSRRFKI